MVVLGRRLFYCVLAAIAACLSTSFIPRPTHAAESLSDVIRVDGGFLRGAAGADTLNFRGIPFAAPPIGRLRFAPPQPAEPWTAIRDATSFNKPCAQGSSINEDCLYLNVTVPRTLGRKKPVMVWLHGGGLSGGSGTTYDPTRMAVEGDVIVVTVDFRLNVFGFFGYKDLPGSGTFGLADQQEALRWIRRNIGAFGGDRENVTLFGQSGGGVATCGQLTSPAANGLFSKAIMQSGGCSTAWPANGVALGRAAGSFFEALTSIEARGESMAAKLGCKSDDRQRVIDCLRDLPASAILGESGNFWSAAYGTSVLPVQPSAAIQKRQHSNVPIISGFTRDESRAVASGMELTRHPITAENYPRLLQEGFGDKAAAVDSHYPLSRYGQPVLAWSAIYTDRMFVCPQLADLRASSASVFAYEFADPHGVGLIPFLPDLPSGAPHTSELPLLFDMTDGPLDITTGKKIPIGPEKLPLAHAMIAYWTNYAHTGNPNGKGLPHWPTYITDAAEPRVQALAPGPGGITQVKAEEAHQCAFWKQF